MFHPTLKIKIYQEDLVFGPGLVILMYSGRESDNAKRRGISDQPPHDDGAENGCIRIRSFIYRLVYFRKDFIWTGRIIFCKTLL